MHFNFMFEMNFDVFNNAIESRHEIRAWALRTEQRPWSEKKYTHLKLNGQKIFQTF